MKKSPLHILCIVGARPNFVKIAPLLREFKKHEKFIRFTLVHTGQHYNKELSDFFFRDLAIAQPDINLNVGSAKRKQQILRIVKKLKPILKQKNPNLVLVVGDTNSTVAGAIAAKKSGIRVVHVEAGLRSFDLGMPEEKNRILTDRLSDYLFIPSPEAAVNLKREHCDKNKKIYFVGNIMIDSLKRYQTVENRSPIPSKKRFALVTLHRPENVDNMKNLTRIARILSRIGEMISVVFPVHPRTQKNMARFGLDSMLKNVKKIPPLGYLDFLKLYKRAAFVLTDSGGVQEETTILNVPCLTLRKNTERPVTITRGTNKLVSVAKAKALLGDVKKILKGKWKKRKRIIYWDGKTAQRITRILLKEAKNW